MEFVPQEEPLGCGVACIAMVTRRSYGDIRQQLGSAADCAITIFEVFEALGRQGFAAQFLFQREQRRGATPCRECWPLRPWAESHILQVARHFVVMLADGSILDPAKGPGLRLEDYPADLVYSMIGVFDVQSRPATGAP